MTNSSGLQAIRANSATLHYSHVYNPKFTTVYELWNYLVRTFQQTNPARQNLATQKWLACMQSPTTSTSEGNTTYLTLLADLQRAGVEANPKQFLNCFLASLNKYRFQEVVTEVSTATKYEESHLELRAAITAAGPAAAALLPENSSKATLEEALSLCIVVETRDGTPIKKSSEKVLVIKEKRQKVCATAGSTGSTKCFFCRMTNHVLENC